MHELGVKQKSPPNRGDYLHVVTLSIHVDVPLGRRSFTWLIWKLFVTVAAEYDVIPKGSSEDEIELRAVGYI